MPFIMYEMKKIDSLLTKRKLFIAGLAIVLLSFVPMLLLGVNSIVPYHDQLDGELVAYIYQAKYLFSGNNRIPEFLNGAYKTSLMPPAPLAVLLFRIVPPFTAYMLLLILGQTLAYTGMFLLVYQVTTQKYAALITALLYAFIPFYPMYGLAQYGIPLLLFAIWQLYQKKHKWLAMGYLAFYAAMSSLVLCGFAWAFLGCVMLLVLLFTGKLKSHLEMLWAFFLMIGIYILENLPLLEQMLGIGAGFVSHKTEYVLTGSKFFPCLWNYLRSNSDHSGDYHQWILYMTVVILGLALLFRKRQTETECRLCQILLGDFGAILFLCLIAALWSWEPVVEMRRHMGSLGAFQVTRVLWIAPALWYLALGLCLTILWNRRNRWEKGIGYGISLLLLAILSFSCLKGSMVKPCVEKLLLPDYEMISWSDYLALGVMDQVETFLQEQEGLEKDQYKVASLGIDPAAALYHGFYCVDGYSNNYDVEYKHAFRKVIAPELEKSEWLRSYYDDWGNRCYLFSGENAGYYTVKKGTSWYNQLQIDTRALKQLGCDYILSAAYIVNAEEIHLELLREEPFETDDSYYRIFVYKIQGL